VGSENALKVEKPREVMALSRTNPSGSAKGHGWDLGIKPLKRRFKADEVLEKSAGTESTWGNRCTIKISEKNFVGRSPRA
jgi:hypothetical protein